MLNHWGWISPWSSPNTSMYLQQNLIFIPDSELPGSFDSRKVVPAPRIPFSHIQANERRLQGVFASHIVNPSQSQGRAHRIYVAVACIFPGFEILLAMHHCRSHHDPPVPCDMEPSASCFPQDFWGRCSTKHQFLKAVDAEHQPLLSSHFHYRVVPISPAPTSSNCTQTPSFCNSSSPVGQYITH